MQTSVVGGGGSAASEEGKVCSDKATVACPFSTPSGTEPEGQHVGAELCNYVVDNTLIVCCTFWHLKIVLSIV